MGESGESPAGGADAARPEPGSDSPRAEAHRFGRRVAMVLAVLVLVVVLFLGVTSRTGFPGPGPIRRYPTSDLQSLAARINDRFPGCQMKGFSSPALAYVDRLRSRVVLRGPAIPLMLKVSDTERSMIQQPSPDGGFSYSSDSGGYMAFCGGGPG